MNSSPSVSIVMPAYNASRYIEATIDSVLKQSFEDYELLIINDCSKDSTASIVERYCERDRRIKLINLSENKGAPAAPRNIGIRKSKGEWIAFLDSDDIWHPNKLQRQIDVLKKTGARFCSTQMIDFVNESTLKLKDGPPDEYKWISFVQQLIRYRTPTSSVIVDRALMERNLFNEDMSYKAREDLDCWLHCHEDIGKSVKIMNPMMGYRIIPGQISGNKWHMLCRHLHVMKKYRFRSGRGLGIGAYIFTFTHFFLALCHRKIQKSM